MGYKIVKLQNASDFPGNPEPTIVIRKGDKDWKACYKNWIEGKNPNDSKEWKRGVIAITRKMAWWEEFLHKMSRWTNRLGRHPFKVKIRGSSPLRDTDQEKGN